ncbi:MAG: HlyD family secretion protein, partial [Hyphomicrobium sp.]
VQVAEARLKQSNQVAFSDPRGMHEIGIARAELALKIAERDFARDLLEKSEIRAQRDGIAMYSDKRDLVGRPVAVGERILEVADASALEARIDLPVADAITLSTGARVRLFLDSDPLSPWGATVRRADYKAKVGESDVVAFRVVADITLETDRPLPRLGVRGTAQISGDQVSLGYFLFRRPITAMRQWLGR